MTTTPQPVRVARGAGLAPAVVLALLVAPLASVAAAAPPRHRGPPPEALQACKHRKADEACTFEGPRGRMAGQCFAPPEMALAGRPAGAPPRSSSEGDVPDSDKPPR